MTDFHTHILPGMDDGAKSLSDSMKLVSAEISQGVDRICLTPHFYASESTYDSFLEKREVAFDALKNTLRGTEKAPELRLGAEVYYYRGISDSDRLGDLKLSGTEILLLEMPFRKWTEYEIAEMDDIASRKDCTVMIAHFERYISENEIRIFERLLGDGALIQSNADFFDGFWQKRKAMSFLEGGYIAALGSDTHSAEKRPPNLNIAYEVIRKKAGNEFLEGFLKSQEEIFEVFKQ